MREHPLFILAVLSGCIALSELLVRRTPLRHLGTALLVIVVAAVVANAGLIPTYSPDVPIYDGIFGHVARVAIFWLLLLVDLRDVLRAGWAMLVLFFAGAIGTTLGVAISMRVVGGEEAFGELHHALGGMFVGTYTGGSINFQALALHYDVVKEAALYAGANAVDAGMTTVWMAASIGIPRLVRPFWPRGRFGLAEEGEAEAAPAAGDEDREAVAPADVGLLLLLGAGGVWLAGVGADWLAERGAAVPSILLLTTLALVIAQTPFARGLRGARMLGMFGVYLFLAVIGVLCDVEALRSIGDLGGKLFAFVTLTILIHGAVTFGAAFLLRLPPDLAAVASQTNIGGGTSALALARSLGRPDLVLPSILVGSLGTAIGTYLGFFTSRFLL
ncbi:MAG: DUF819 family protein [Planctomycetota bacterium]